MFEARGRSADDVGRTSTEDYFADKPQAAVRPLNSVLDLSKITATGFTPARLADRSGGVPGGRTRLGASPDSVNLGFESLVAERCGEDAPRHDR